MPEFVPQNIKYNKLWEGKLPEWRKMKDKNEKEKTLRKSDAIGLSKARVVDYTIIHLK